MKYKSGMFLILFKKMFLSLDCRTSHLKKSFWNKIIYNLI
ncbi:hypothetical protein CCYN49044_60136 [Capnocytophaga cynodegmi]|nr:hypothetical protein CCYN49044_60136 [Capnocytophaga cynodegmi]